MKIAWENWMRKYISMYLHDSVEIIRPEIKLDLNQSDRKYVGIRNGIKMQLKGFMRIMYCE